VSDTPWRANRTIQEQARAMMKYAMPSVKLWAEAVNTAPFLKNLSQTMAVTDIVLKEAWNVQNIYVKTSENFWP
jgi:hypothetical protein